LIAMHKRVASLDGAISMDNDIDGGFAIRALIPIGAEHQWNSTP